MSNRLDIINRFYDGSGEADRLSRSRHGQLEYFTTMHYIHKMLPDNGSILSLVQVPADIRLPLPGKATLLPLWNWQKETMSFC